MGYQQGTLPKTEITRKLRAFHAFYEDEQDIHRGDLVDTREKQEPYVCRQVIDYIQGTAYNSQCRSMAAWGSATKTGELSSSGISPPGRVRRNENNPCTEAPPWRQKTARWSTATAR